MLFVYLNILERISIQEFIFMFTTQPDKRFVLLIELKTLQITNEIQKSLKRLITNNRRKQQN